MNLQFFAEDSGNDDNQEGKGEANKQDEKHDDKSKPNQKDNKTKHDTGDTGNKKPAEEDVLTDDDKQKLIDQGKNDMLKELGLDENEDGQKFINFFKSFMESQNANDETAPDVDELKRKTLLAETKVDALKNGAKPEYVDDVVTLAIQKRKGDEPLNDVVVRLKAKYEFFFGEDDTDQANEGTGSSTRHKKKKNEVEGIGARLAANKKKSKTTKSYWN